MHLTTRLSLLAAFAVTVGLAPAAVATGVPAMQTQAQRHASANRANYTIRFTDVTGHPLEDVQVEADSYTGIDDPVVRATSNAKGYATLRLAIGAWFVQEGGQRITGGSSDATGYAGDFQRVRISSTKPTMAGTLALRPGGALRVHLMDDSGHPVVGALPTAFPVLPYVQADTDSFIAYDLDPGPGAKVVSDQDGTALIKGLASQMAVQVCAGYVSTAVSGSYAPNCSQHTTLARAGRIVDTPPLELDHVQRAGTIVGRVVRSGGGTAAGTVQIMRGSNDSVDALPTTSHGRFEVSGLRAGRYRACAVGGAYQQAGRTGYTNSCSDEITVPSSGAVQTTITLGEGAAISGRVSGPRGAAVRNASVYATVPAATSLYGSAAAVTDASGHFVLKGLPRGSTRACVDATTIQLAAAFRNGAVSTCGRQSRKITVTPGRVRTGIDFRLRPGAAVAGRVLDSTGAPVRGADVELDKKVKGGDPFDGDDAADATTDRSGRFLATGLTAGTYTMCVSTFDIDAAGTNNCPHRVVTVRQARRTTGVQLVVPATAAVKVTVVDQHQHPVAGVNAVVVRGCGRDCPGPFPLLAGQHVDSAASDVTDGSGKVLLNGLRPGTYDVCLFGYYGATRAGSPVTGYADRCAHPKPVTVLRGGQTIDQRVVLHDGGAVTGRVTDSAGNPLSGVIVHVAGSAADDVPAEDEFGDGGNKPSPPPLHYSRTAADGTFTVYGVRPGRRLVCVNASHAQGGTSTGGYLSQCLGGTPGNSKQGTPITVSADATTGGVDLSLSAGAAVSGTVHVTLAKHDYEFAVALFSGGKFVRQVQPGSHGTYRIGRLAAGTYQVCAAVFGSHNRGRCYKDAAWNPESDTPASGATPVTAQSGTDTADIDITIPK